MVTNKKKVHHRKKHWTLWKFILVFIVSLGKLTWNIIKIPYWIVKGIMHASRKTTNTIKTKSVEKQRERIVAQYEPLKVIRIDEGKYEKWEQKIISSDSTIGIIVGARGSGKTALGVKWVENVHAKTGKKVYAMGFHASEMPSWIHVVENIEAIENDSLVLIDEGGILFSSRSGMSNANKVLSELLFISRHKNLSILFIAQNSANLEINALRQADFIVLKPGSLLQQEFERDIIRKLYEKARKGFKEFEHEQGLCYLYSTTFRGFITNPLPSFWTQKISKSFR